MQSSDADTTMVGIAMAMYATGDFERDESPQLMSHRVDSLLYIP